MKNYIYVRRTERLTTIENTTLGKTDSDFVTAFAGSIPFKNFFDDWTFFGVNKHFLLFGVVTVIKFTRAMQSFKSGFSLSASGLLR